MNTRARAVTITLATTAVIALFRLVFNPLFDNWNVDPLLRSAVYIAIIFFLLTLGTLWVLFYKVDFKFLITGGLFPFLCFIPFWGISESLINGLSEAVGISLAILISSGLIALIIYFLILTVNILNGARLKSVPLGQAAKATHFIFVLVASYFFFTFIFTTSMPILLSILATLIYVGYMSFSSIENLNLPRKEERLMISLITILMGLAFAFMAFWPIIPVYSSLIMTIIYYVLLNVALEMRESITKYIWLEYLLLFTLIIVVLFANAVWGVNGTII